ncbi:hypothetical protein FHR92_000237 [Fontibacillus solani]|uniref:Uncharacterized protein n=1 Tax=Fontibacillus solani TaxID=1572857 RepID=A0A7W3XPT2_9BACL|nr:hypothetical protein [Fontibacillus solani]MBA9083794.1 hypothetical protein [Fontibacillus solani]
MTDNIQNTTVSKMESLEASYKKVDIVKSLKKLDPSQKGQTIETKEINGATPLLLPIGVKKVKQTALGFSKKENSNPKYGQSFLVSRRA